MNHGQKSGLGSRVRCQAGPRRATVGAPFPGKHVLDTTVPNLTAVTGHYGFQVWSL